MIRKNVWTTYNNEQLRATERFSKDYRTFLDNAKTERECVNEIVEMAEANGYTELNSLLNGEKKLGAGSKVYCTWMNKTIMLFNIGTAPMSEGMNILGAHIDSPRCDVKQNPLYEDGGMAYLDTHYYGGIKKYQYVALPLALHGVVVRKDGTICELNVGEDEDDPVFFFSDLLIHLAQEQMQKKASVVIEGEMLDLIIGSKPFIIEGEKKKEEKKTQEMTAGQQYAASLEKEETAETAKLKNAVKRGIIAILKDNYGFGEEDFISAELEIVPAGKAREAGFDRSMIMAYGHDDRVCAYPSARALFDTKGTSRTCCCILVDKEEIGSYGASGMQSRVFENTVAEILNLMHEDTGITLRRCLANSCMLSSDVSSTFDPQFASSFEKKNAAHLGCGMVFNKFTGSRGKSNSNDANAEYMAHIRKIFDDESIVYQTAELGKVDLGGGGTIAWILSHYGMNVIDSGVPVLNMHAPFEVVSKADIYETYRGYMAFLKNAELKNL